MATRLFRFRLRSCKMVTKLEYEQSRLANVGVICLGLVEVGLASSLGCGITTCASHRPDPFRSDPEAFVVNFRRKTTPEIAHD